MLSKEAEEDTTCNWHKNLIKVEFALNNTINRSTGFTASTLLFGVNQRGECCDKVMEYLQESIQKNDTRDLNHIREQASNTIKKNQDHNKNHFDMRHKPPRKYKVGDYVVLKNVVTTVGVNKKRLPKYRGPFEVAEVLHNDRYIVKDVEGLQLSRVPYKGVCSPANMKPYME